MEFIKRKNYLVILTYGAFIQKHIQVSENLELLPLKPVYEECLVNYVATTCNDFKIGVEKNNLEQLYEQVKNSRPTTAIVISNEETYSSVENLEEQLEEDVKKLKLILSFISGDSLTEFGRIVKLETQTYFRMIPFFSRKRQKLYFSKEEEESFYATALEISTSNRFFMSLLHDANHELNTLFRIARYFGVLEAISNRYQQSDHKGSKDRIRFMLYNDKSKRNTIKTNLNGKDVELDPIEISYRFRNNYFHGGEPTYDKFEDLMPSEIFESLKKESNILINSLQGHCELQLMKEINK